MRDAVVQDRQIETQGGVAVEDRVEVPDDLSSMAAEMPPEKLAAAPDIGDKAVSAVETAERKQKDSPVIGGVAIYGGYPGQGRHHAGPGGYGFHPAFRNF
jgi:hypothetical protein